MSGALAYGFAYLALANWPLDRVLGLGSLASPPATTLALVVQAEDCPSTLGFLAELEQPGVRRVFGTPLVRVVGSESDLHLVRTRLQRVGVDGARVAASSRWTAWRLEKAGIDRTPVLLVFGHDRAVLYRNPVPSSDVEFAAVLQDMLRAVGRTVVPRHLTVDDTQSPSHVGAHLSSPDGRL